MLKGSYRHRINKKRKIMLVPLDATGQCTWWENDCSNIFTYIYILETGAFLGNSKKDKQKRNLKKLAQSNPDLE